MKKTLTAMASGLALFAMACTALADITEHDTLPACYASVHAQCYGNGADNCSDDDYNWGLDQCDSSYPSAQIGGTKRPGGLKGGNTLLKRN